MLAGFIEHAESQHAEGRRGHERIARLRRIPQRECDQFCNNHRDVDVARRVAPEFVILDGRPQSRHLLDRPMRGITGICRDDRGHGAEDQQRRRSLSNKLRTAKPGDGTEQDAHEQQGDSEVDDLRMKGAHESGL